MQALARLVDYLLGRGRYPNGDAATSLFLFALTAIGLAPRQLQAADIDLIPLSGVAQVVAGGSHSCALLLDSSVKCWGGNSSQQLGDSLDVSSSYAIDVSGLDRGVVAITTGASHACALTNQGGVKCWGSNTSGQLGGPTVDTSWLSSPAQDVPGMMEEVQAIDAGEGHTCALRVDGSVRCWGNNFYGQLGDGTYVESNLPVDVLGLDFGAVAISAGASHTCALLSNGLVKCWGDNLFGQLGDVDLVEFGSPVPVQVRGLSGDLLSISVGRFHSCALRNDGAVFCWGGNQVGQLGLVGPAILSTPAQVAGFQSPAIAVSAGDGHTCVVNQLGNAECWGSNSNGELGRGATGSPEHIPRTVVDSDGTYRGISSGAAHTCASTSSRHVKCWGFNGDGRLGNGLTQPTGGPTLALKRDLIPHESVVQVSAGHAHSCSVDVSGVVRCWGLNADGQLGNGVSTHASIPVRVQALPRILEVRAGGRHTCSLSVDGGVHCWGDNTFGQLGDGTTDGSTQPVPVLGLQSGVRSVGAGFDHSCALKHDGSVLCWGKNTRGQLGVPTVSASSVPVVLPSLQAAQRLSAGYDHNCIINSGAGAQCWGENFYGQLGDGNRVTTSTLPVSVVGLDSGIVDLQAGRHHTCAVTAQGSAKCWGRNDEIDRQLGNSGLLAGPTATYPTPVDVTGLQDSVTRLATWSSHSCALLEAGELKCWGSNSGGQLGTGNSNATSEPRGVVTLSGAVIAMSVGSEHTCAVLEQGPLKCWGANSSGQVGDARGGPLRTPRNVYIRDDNIVFASGFED